MTNIGYVAQSEERPAFNRVVVGSIPIMANCLLEDVTFCCPVGSPLGDRVVLLEGRIKCMGARSHPITHGGVWRGRLLARYHSLNN